MRSFVLAAGLTLLATGIFAQSEANSPEPPKPDHVEITIHVDRTNDRMWFTPRHSVKLCGAIKKELDARMAGGEKSRLSCDGDQQITWKPEHALETGETLKIDNAPDHVKCFEDDKFPAEFHGPGSFAHNSGPPKKECAEDSFGVYWPYVVTLEIEGEDPIVSDPGGIIFP